MSQKHVFLIFFGCFIPIFCIAQENQTVGNDTLQEIIITAFKDEPIKNTSLNIESIKTGVIARHGNFTLTDILAQSPGVTMLSTGVAISKPVIRGLYGNRVLVLLSGLKFDNQQWQEEHGLGLSNIGLSEVELIKGPMSVLYGSEAIGGVVNLIEEQKPKTGERESDVSFKFNSNTLGGTLQAGYKANYGNKWFRVRVGVDNNADYSDSNGKRVLNSRFDGYYLKSTFGFQHKKWTSENNLMSSYNRFGFIFNDIYTFLKSDARWSRQLGNNPAHLVLLNIFSSENKFDLGPKSKLSVSGGVQSNIRMENEGGGAISLNMHLLTLQALVKYDLLVKEGHHFILSSLQSFEDNTNYGARKIVPDARMQESNLSLYYEVQKRAFAFENGVNVGEKYIRTYFTPTVNGQGKDIQPFTKNSPYFNVYSGFSLYPNRFFNLKANVSTGVRIPNLAELSSDGLHEGVFTYEIGDPKLKNEQNLCANVFLNYQNSLFGFSLSPFYNYFFNYVFLAPTTEQWYGYPINRYRQQDARQYGTEATVGFKPFGNFKLDVSYSGMISKTLDGNYTPYLPAQKLTPALSYRFRDIRQGEYSVFTDVQYNFKQDKVYPNEVKTPSYMLLNAGITYNRNVGGKTYTLSLIANNILNKAYYDHLSRFKYFGINNIGRNITLSIGIKFRS